MSNLYEQDFYGWTQEQAVLLKQGKLTQLDIENLIEEIESLGRQERRELVNRLAILLAHLLKWQYQPLHRGASWRLTLKEQRRRIDRLLEDNPSLKPYLSKAIVLGYEDAIDIAMRETGLAGLMFPSHCSYTIEELLDREFFPED